MKLKKRYIGFIAPLILSACGGGGGSSGSVNKPSESLQLYSESSPHLMALVNGQKTQNTMTIENVGNSTIDIQSLPSLNAPLSYDARSTCLSGRPLSAHQTCDLIIDLTPGGRVIKQTPVIINITDNNHENLVVKMSYEVTASPQSQISMTPLTGNLLANVGDTKSSDIDEIYTVKNTGTGAASLTLPTVTSPLSVTSNGCGATLPAGGSCQFTVQLDTSAVVGANHQTLTLQSTNPSASINSTLNYQVLSDVPQRVAYWSNWDNYSGTNYQITDLNKDDVTQIHYAFFEAGNCARDNVTYPLTGYPTEKDIVTDHATSCGSNTLNNGQIYESGKIELHSTDAFSDYTTAEDANGGAGNIDKALATNKPVYMVVGGWSLSAVLREAMTASYRANFVQSIIDELNLIKANSGSGKTFAGVEIDYEPNANKWTLPAVGSDYVSISVTELQDYLDFIKLLRQQLDAHFGAGKKGISIALPAGKDVINDIESKYYTSKGLNYFASFSSYINYYDTMSYDYHGSGRGETVTNFNSPLVNDPAQPAAVIHKDYNIDDTMKDYISHGVRSIQMLLGVPLYGRVYQTTSSSIYQPGTTAGDVCNTGDGAGVIKYNEVMLNKCNDATDPQILHFAKQSDNMTVAQSIWSDGSNLTTLDTPATLPKKLSYIRKKDLAGVMFWDAGGDIKSSDADYSSDSLLHLASTALQTGSFYVDSSLQIKTYKGSTANTRTITLYNLTKKTLKVSSITGATQPLTIINDHCSLVSLASGDSCQFDVSLDTSAVVLPLNMVLHINDDQGGSSSVTVSVAVSAGEMKITPATQTWNQQVGDPSPTHSFTVRNTSGGSLRLSNITLSTPFNLVSGQDHCSGQILVDGSSCQFTVSLSTAVQTTGNGLITVNAVDGSSVASQQQYSVTPVKVANLVSSIDHTSLSVVQNNTAPTATLTIKNTGTAVASALGVAILNDPKGLLRVTNDGCSGQNLSVNASCTVEITLDSHTLSGGVQNATITVPYTGHSALTQGLSYEVTASPQSQISMTPLTGNLLANVGDTKSSDINEIYTVKNTGTGAASLTLPTVTSPLSVTSNRCGATLPAGGSCQFTVQLDTSAVVGANHQTLTLQSTNPSASINSTLNYQVTDYATPGIDTLMLTSSGIDAIDNNLHTMKINTSVNANNNNYSIYLTDIGISNRVIGSVGLSSSNDLQISHDSCSGVTLHPADSCEIELHLSNNVAQTASNAITIPVDGKDMYYNIGYQIATAKPSINISSTGESFTAMQNSHNPTMTYTVTNDGQAALALSNIGGLTSPLSESDNCANKTLNPSDSCSITVSLSTAAVVAKSQQTLVINAQNSAYTRSEEIDYAVNSLPTSTGKAAVYDASQCSALSTDFNNYDANKADITTRMNGNDVVLCKVSSPSKWYDAVDIYYDDAKTHLLDLNLAKNNSDDCTNINLSQLAGGYPIFTGAYYQCVNSTSTIGGHLKFILYGNGSSQYIHQSISFNFNNGAAYLDVLPNYLLAVSDLTSIAHSSGGVTYDQVDYHTTFPLSSEDHLHLTDNYNSLIMINLIGGSLLYHMIDEYYPGIKLNKYTYATLFGQFLQESGAADAYLDQYEWAALAVNTPLKNLPRISLLGVGQGGPYQLNDFAKKFGNNTAIIGYDALRKGIGFTENDVINNTQTSKQAPYVFDDKYYTTMAAAFFHFNDITRLEHDFSTDFPICINNLKTIPDAKTGFLDMILNAIYNAGPQAPITKQYIKFCTDFNAYKTQINNLNDRSADKSTYNTEMGFNESGTFLLYPRQIRYYVDQLYNIELGHDVKIDINVAQLRYHFDNAMHVMSYPDTHGNLQYIPQSTADSAFKAAMRNLGVTDNDVLQLYNSSERSKIFSLLDQAIGNVESLLPASFLFDHHETL